MTDYLEDALSAEGRQRFERHLARLPHCTEYLAQMRETIRLAGRVAPEDLTRVMRADLTDRTVAGGPRADGQAPADDSRG